MIEKNRINGNKRKIAAIGAAVALAVGLAACGSTVEKAPQSPPASTSTEQGPQQETPEKSLRPISSETDPEALAGYVQKVADLYEERLQGLEIQGVSEFIDAIRLAQSSPAEAANILTGLGVTQRSIEINDKLYKEACSDSNLVKAYESLEVFCPNQLSTYFNSTGVVELLPSDFDYTDTNPTNISTIPLLLGLPTNMDIKQKSDVSSLVESLVFRDMNDIGEISNTDLTAANTPQEMGIENWLNALLAKLAQVNHDNSPVVIGIKDPEQKKAWGDQYEKIVNGALQIVKENSVS